MITTARHRIDLLPDFIIFTLGLGAILLALAAASARAEPDEPPAGDGPVDDDDDHAPPCQSPASPPEVYYACLRTGTLRERVAAATLLADSLPLFDPADDDDPAGAEGVDTEATVDELLRLVRQEPDDWVSRALLVEIHWHYGEAPNRLFRAMLDDGSINLVAVAVRRFTFISDPLAAEALQKLWSRDLPGWLRPSLIEALAEQESAVHLADFIRLTRDDDDETRAAAISALGRLGLEEGRPALLRAARAGSPRDRETALLSLAALPFSDETLAEALRSSRAGPPAVREAAFTLLQKLAHPDADTRLIAALEEPLPDSLRAAAANGLADSQHPDATAALVRLLHTLPPESDPCLAIAAVRILYNRDDPDAVPGLLDLGFRGDWPDYPSIAVLIGYLSRDRAPAIARRITPISCGSDNGAPPDPDEVDAFGTEPFRVDPPPPLRTIRCWDGPDLPGDPVERLRVPAGTQVEITDHFERPAESWVEIDGGESDCWVPLSQVTRGAAGAQGSRRDSRPRIELDVRTVDLETVAATRLLEAGFLEVFDPGDEVSGVALTADPSVPEQAALLRVLLAALPDDPEYPLRAGLEALLEPPLSIDGNPRVP